MCVYSLSGGVDDILEGIQQGNSYLTFAPNGPSLEAKAGEAILGESVDFRQVRELQVRVAGLAKGDIVQVVTADERTTLLQASTDGELESIYKMKTSGFARVEVLRGFLPGLPLLPALISNPIYFEDR